MSELAATQQSTGTNIHPSFARKKIFTLIGLVPLGGYVVHHLLTNSKSWTNPEAFDLAIKQNHESWYSWVWTVLLLLFVFYHAAVGISLMLKSAPFSPPPTRLKHWQYILQRISALGILLFIPAHVLKAKILPALSGNIETFATMHEVFTGEEAFLTVPVYVLGTAGVAYHLANGFWTSAVSLGLAQGAKAQNRLVAISVIVFLTLISLSYGTIFAIIRG